MIRLASWMLTLHLLSCSGTAGPVPTGEQSPGPAVTLSAEEESTDPPTSGRDAGPETTPTPTPETTPEMTPTPNPPGDLEPEVIRFEYCPSRRVADAYALEDERDRHRIVLTPGVQSGGKYPVVVAFHGQPKRGRDPRDYWFPDRVQDQIVSMVRSGEIAPVILVIPVFRFVGGNWPWMNPGKLREHVESLLNERNIEGNDWYAFGHSGAAGCGGGGLNQAHLMKPAGVGYFDTCLGDDWKKAIADLSRAGVRTVNIHSVETAGFRPRQDPEYQSWFDFGRAYGPAGLSPIACPEVHPGKKLRDQKYRCASSKDGLISGFIIDSGEGVEAHKAIVAPAIRYFLVHFARLGR